MKHPLRVLRPYTNLCKRACPCRYAEGKAAKDFSLAVKFAGNYFENHTKQVFCIFISCKSKLFSSFLSKNLQKNSTQTHFR
jgi:hypothetical protein